MGLAKCKYYLYIGLGSTAESRGSNGQRPHESMMMMILRFSPCLYHPVFSYADHMCVEAYPLVAIINYIEEDHQPERIKRLAMSHRMSPPCTLGNDLPFR